MALHLKTPPMKSETGAVGGRVETQAIVVPLEVLFCSPIILKFKDVCRFLEKCHYYTQGDEKMSLRCNLNECAIKSEIWPADKTWRHVIQRNDKSLENKQLETLRTCIEKKNGTHKKTLKYYYFKEITELVRIIRNNYIHGDELDDNDLRILGWDKEVSKSKDGLKDESRRELKFCDKKFVTYWTTLFPRLLPFLWENYKNILNKNNPGGSYPSFMKSQYLSGKLYNSTTAYGEQISTSLSLNLEQGWMEDRFICKNDLDVWTLEFRTLETCYVGVNKSSFLEIEISNTEKRHTFEETIISRWYEIYHGKTTVSDKRITTLPCEKTNLKKESFVGRILICNQLSALDGYFTNNKCIEIFQRGGKIIILTNREQSVEEEEAKKGIFIKFLKISGRNFASLAVNWNDLDDRTKSTLIEQVNIKILGKRIKLTDFIENICASESSVMQNFKGQDLNEVLKSKTISIFTPDVNFKSAVDASRYVPRSLNKLGTVTSNFFPSWNSKSQSNVFIITNSGKQETPCIENIRFTSLVSIKNLIDFGVNDPQSKFFWVEEPIEDITKVSGNVKSLLLKDFVHIFECSGTDTFKYVELKQSLSKDIVDSIYKEASITPTDEEACLNHILKCRRPGEIIFICGKAGIGKTQLLMNFAQILMKREKTFVLFFDMREVVENVGNIITKHEVINTIVNLSCSKVFEREIFSHLLHIQDYFSFELMIDGSDEVQTEHKCRVFQILKIFQTEIPWMRLWITGRSHMSADITNKLGVFGYKILPFSRTDQISCLVNFWKQSLRNVSTSHVANSNHPSDSILETFASRCLEKYINENNADIVGVPLQCIIIGEIMEANVRDGKFGLDDLPAIKLDDMYDAISQKKLQIYLEEKQKIPKKFGKDAINSHINEIFRFLVYLSIKLIYSENVANALKRHLQIPQTEEELIVLEANILLHGVVQSLKPLKFIHQTFAEYYAASFISKEINQCINNDNTLNLLSNAIKKFIWNHVLATEESFVSWKFKHETVINFLNLTLEQVLSDLSKIFKEAESESTFCELTEMLEGLQDRQLIFIKTDHSVPRYITQFKSAIDSKLKTIIKLVIIEPHYPLHPFLFALSTQQLDIIRFIIEKMNFGPNNWRSVRNYDKSESGILHRIVQICFSLKDMNLHESFTESIKQCSLIIRYVTEQNKSLIKEKDSEGRTPYLLAMKFVTKLAYAVDLKSFETTSPDTKLELLNLSGRFCFLEPHERFDEPLIIRGSVVTENLEMQTYSQEQGFSKIVFQKVSNFFLKHLRFNEQLEPQQSCSSAIKVGKTESHAYSEQEISKNLYKFSLVDIEEELEPQQSGSSAMKVENIESRTYSEHEFSDILYQHPSEYYDHVIDTLVDLKANTNVTDNDKNTVLHIQLSSPLTVNSEHFDSIRYAKFLSLFISRAPNKAQLNQFNKNGNTPLLSFLDNCKSILGETISSEDESSFRKIFDVFKYHHTDFNAKDIRNKNENILDKAIQRGYPGCLILLLLEYGIYVLDENGRHICAKNVSSENLDQFLDAYRMRIKKFERTKHFEPKSVQLHEYNLESGESCDDKDKKGCILS